MKKDDDKILDDLFKRKFEDPVYDTDYLEGDWNDLEKIMNKPAKRRAITFWLPILSSAAALLLFFGWLLFKPEVVPNNIKKQQATIIHNPKHTDLNKLTENTIAGTKIKPAPSDVADNKVKGHESLTGVGAANDQKRELAGNYNNNKHDVVQAPASTNRISGRKNTITVIPEVNNNPVAVVNNNTRPVAASLTAINSNSLLDGAATNQYMALIPVESKDIIGVYIPPLPKYGADDDNDKGTTKLGFVKHPQYALTFTGASELNSASSLGDAKSGTNLGLLFSAGVFNKLTVTTGANYSVKPYDVDAANYHTTYTFKTDPSDIEADCRVLDIPINLDYQLYNKHNNQFSIGTGLSSYIMLHESYQYYYADPTTKGPVAFTVPNSGKYFFGIMNLQATYRHQVNSKVGLSIQPYMKLPLTNIGYSQVRLQTAGVAVGLSWNINSLTKP